MRGAVLAEGLGPITRALTKTRNKGDWKRFQYTSSGAAMTHGVTNLVDLLIIVKLRVFSSSSNPDVCLVLQFTKEY